MSQSLAARQSWKPCGASARWRPTSPTKKSSAERRTTPRTSGCRSKTPWSTEWTTSCSTRTARSPRSPYGGVRCRPASRCSATLRVSSARSPGNFSRTTSNAERRALLHEGSADSVASAPSTPPEGAGVNPYHPSARTGHFMSTISIIGTGNMARTIATLAIAGGNTVEVIGRDQSKAAELAKTLGDSTTTGEFGTLPAGDVVILAVLFDSAVSIVSEYGDALAGKII